MMIGKDVFHELRVGLSPGREAVSALETWSSVPTIAFVGWVINSRQGNCFLPVKIYRGTWDVGLYLNQLLVD